MNAKKVGFWATILIVIFFILDGDRWEFLPQPMRNASFETRMFFIGLWPDWLKPRDRDEQRQEEIDRLQGQVHEPLLILEPRA
ncbi:hypothetical protein E1H12_22030 [Geitlerinema sp. P-1104]|uniref:hypothetical protein n=1 Tax=Geitlerinema sp. P-1104 TaxID=2546230 RepID=UPI0014772C18|nr:hypothetical protein [Geitlerinema sp. P-1104]NMG61116.1 hypothetical protein [Geitlerinema sp. P-1104]